MIQRPPSSLPTLALACVLGCLPAASQAQAVPAPWFARASLALLHDTNYLRLADGQAAPAGYTKSDKITVGSVSAGFYHTFGTDQRAYGRAELRSNRQANNNRFDSEGWRVVAGIDWRTAGQISGELRLLADRSQAAFESGVVGVPVASNLIDLTQADAVFRYGRTTGLNTEAAFGWREVDYSAAQFDSRDFHESWASAGLRYRPSERSSIGLSLRGTRGSYPRFRALAGGAFQADDYRGRFVDLTATYVATGKSTLNARLSSGRTTHADATQSGYDGLSGNLRWDWNATRKLTLSATLSREPMQDAYFLAAQTSNRPIEFGRITSGARLGADYEASARLRMRASLEAVHRELSQSFPLAAGGAALVNGSDRAWIGGLGVSWEPVRWISLGCDIGHESRKGKAPLAADITVSKLGCQVQLQLEGGRQEGR